MREDTDSTFHGRIAGHKLRLAVATSLVAGALFAYFGLQTARSTDATPLSGGALQLPTASQEPAGWGVSYPITFPSGYVSTSGIATSSGGSNVWAFSQGLNSSGSAEEAAFEWSSNGTLEHTFNMNLTNHSMAAGVDTPIVVDSQGRAWIGVNQNLLIADPTTGDLTSVTLPNATVGSQDSGLPQLPSPSWLSFDQIDALALEPDGSIAVARMFSTTLDVVDPTTLSVTQVSLPPNTAFIGIGSGDIASSDGGGVVAAALINSSGQHVLGVLNGTAWSTEVGSCDYDQVAFDGTSLVASSLDCASVISNPADSITDTANETDFSSVSLARFGFVGGQLVSFDGSTASGSASATSVNLGQGEVAPSIGGSSSTSDATVAIVPIEYSDPTSSTEWFVPSVGGGRYLGVIQSS
jgi:hypothetical protein